MAQNSIDRQLAKAYTQRQLEKKMNTESRETRDVPSDRSKPIVAYSYNPLYIVVVDRKPNFWLGNEFLGIPKNIESRALSDGIYPTRTEATRYVVQRDVAHFDWGSLTYTFFIYLTAWSPFEQRAQSEFWILPSNTLMLGSSMLSCDNSQNMAWSLNETAPRGANFSPYSYKLEIMPDAIKMDATTATTASRDTEKQLEQPEQSQSSKEASPPAKTGALDPVEVYQVQLNDEEPLELVDTFKAVQKQALELFIDSPSGSTVKITKPIMTYSMIVSDFRPSEHS